MSHQVLDISNPHVRESTDPFTSPFDEPRVAPAPPVGAEFDDGIEYTPIEHRPYESPVLQDQPETHAQPETHVFPDPEPSSAGYANGGFDKEALGASESGMLAKPAVDPRDAPLSAAQRAKRRLVLGCMAGGAVIVAVAFVLALVLSDKPTPAPDPTTSAAPDSSGNATSTSGAAPSTTPSPGTPGSLLAVTGGNGTTVITDDGGNFTYTNIFNGTWYFDENDVFNTSAKCNLWTPALNETFKFGTDRIFGVNLAGWLNTEPFAAPALYEKYQNSTTPAVDEYTLSLNMAKDGGVAQLENHYKTFITEQDFAQIAGAGLNFVRIPLPYWAIEVRDDEPFLAKVSWTYFLKAIKWSRKYGLRINLDLHSLPGSQNGFFHSGKQGTVNMLNGTMGYANAQRSLDYIRVLAEFISQPEYRDVVAMFGITNELSGATIGMENVQRYYAQAYDLVRNASGAGQGPYISYSDAFWPLANWTGFMPGADRISLDTHAYFAFANPQPAGQMDAVMSQLSDAPCREWAQDQNKSMDAFGLTVGGEFSLAATDCGTFVSGVNRGYRYEGTFQVNGTNTTRVGSCEQWTDYQKWDQPMRYNMGNLTVASMDALQNWFFKSWKVAPSNVTGQIMAPAWSYQLGWQQGWIPADPRTALGKCQNKFPRSSTGLPSATSIAPSATSAIAWPPTAIANAGPVTAVPSYSATGPIPTLPAPTFTSTSGVPAATATPSVGNGWNQPSDTAGMAVPVSGCTYPDPWDGSAQVPVPLCGGAAAPSASAGARRGMRRVPRAHFPRITAPPRAH